MFHILEREVEWRRQNGKAQGYGTMCAFRPVIAVGAEDPLEDQKMLADYFRMHSIQPMPGNIGLTYTPQMERMALAASTQVYVLLNLHLISLNQASDAVSAPASYP